MGLFDRFKKPSQPAEGLPYEYECKVVGMRHHEAEHDAWVRSGRRSMSLEIVDSGKFAGAVQALGDGQLIGYVANEDSIMVNQLLKTKQYVISQVTYYGPYYLVVLQFHNSNQPPLPARFIDESDDDYDDYNSFDYEKWEKKEKELRPYSDEYYDNLKKIEDTWSLMTTLKDFEGPRAEAFEKLCLKSTGLYFHINHITKKYGDEPLRNCPAYKRLAMLYEKQKRYEEAVEVCAAAIRAGSTAEKMSSRYIRMIKKTGREPNEKELELADSAMNK